mmetsp:Transcript_101317/g.254027  ORF Transcript_101317/g.254027 Transcript_101317/m.254027 type:complete len:211 (-) Transcript_101317:396-1028(-)
MQRGVVQNGPGIRIGLVQHIGTGCEHQVQVTPPQACRELLRLRGHPLPRWRGGRKRRHRAPVGWRPCNGGGRCSCRSDGPELGGDLSPVSAAGRDGSSCCRCGRGARGGGCVRRPKRQAWWAAHEAGSWRRRRRCNGCGPAAGCLVLLDACPATASSARGNRLCRTGCANAATKGSAGNRPRVSALLDVPAARAGALGLKGEAAAARGAP